MIAQKDNVRDEPGRVDTLSRELTTSDGRPHKYLGLQVLRIFAACLVLITHSTYYVSERMDAVFPTWDRGTTGVDIFFVISGFVMIYSSRNLLGMANGWLLFAERRLVRIVPLYWFATLIKLGTMLVASGVVLHASLTGGTILSSLFFIPYRNVEGEFRPLLGVGWTLNFEMFFYLIFSGALLLRLNVYRSIGITLSCLALGAYFRKESWPAGSFYLDSVVLEFFFGMLIAKLCLTGRHIPQALSVAILPLAIGLLLASRPENHFPKAFVDGLPAALLVWAAASIGSWEAKIPRLILYLADCSYAIYLFHPMAARAVPAILLKTHMQQPYLSILFSIVVSLLVGAIVHRYFEVPIQRHILKRFRPA